MQNRLDTTFALQHRLFDVDLVEAPGIWPPAPGWWAVLGAIFLLAVGSYFYHRTVTRIRRAALHDLWVLARLCEDDERLVAQVSELLKRVALLKTPRDQVAGLTGEKWLSFLDRTGGGGAFANGPGRVLADRAFMRQGEAVAKEDLLLLARMWIVRNT